MRRLVRPSHFLSVFRRLLKLPGASLRIDFVSSLLFVFSDNSLQSLARGGGAKGARSYSSTCESLGIADRLVVFVALLEVLLLRFLGVALLEPRIEFICASWRGRRIRGARQTMETGDLHHDGPRLASIVIFALRVAEPVS